MLLTCGASAAYSDRGSPQEVPRPVGFHDNRAMRTNPQSPWWPRIAAFLLAGLAAASAVYWGLKWPNTSAANAAGAAASVLVAETAPANPQALARALGGGNVVAEVAQQPAAVAAASLASRLALVGVVAYRSRGGAALISVDGKPARPYRVGARVEDSLVLQSVAARRAVLAEKLQGPASVTLELPPLSK